MLSQNSRILGEILDRLDDGVLVLSSSDRCHRVIYCNARYRELWLGTGAMQSVGQDYTYPHEEAINKAIREGRTYQKSIQFNSGSVPRFFYLKLFPANASHYIEISRDITETYTRHHRDREYKSLFLALFEKSILPTGLVNISGVLTMANPEFYLDLSDRQTISAVGTPVWQFFPSHEYELKERFEQLVTGSSRDFEFDGYYFFAVRNRGVDPDIISIPENAVIWVLLKKRTLRPIQIQEAKVPAIVVEEPELEQLKDVVRTYHALMRFAKWLQGLPWGILTAIVVGGSGAGAWWFNTHSDPPPAPSQGQSP